MAHAPKHGHQPYEPEATSPASSSIPQGLRAGAQERLRQARHPGVSESQPQDPPQTTTYRRRASLARIQDLRSRIPTRVLCPTPIQGLLQTRCTRAADRCSRCPPPGATSASSDAAAALSSPNAGCLAVAGFGGRRLGRGRQGAAGQGQDAGHACPSVLAFDHRPRLRGRDRRRGQPLPDKAQTHRHLEVELQPGTSANPLGRFNGNISFFSSASENFKSPSLISKSLKSMGIKAPPVPLVQGIRGNLSFHSNAPGRPTPTAARTPPLIQIQRRP